MRHCLNAAQSPLDCHIEAVLPAVHHRFDANYKATVDVSKEVAAVSEQVGLLRKEIAQRSDLESIRNDIGHMKKFLLRVQEGFIMGFKEATTAEATQDEGGLSQQGHGSALLTPTVGAPVGRIEARNDQAHSTNHPIIPLLSIYKDLHDFYLHWCGEGIYQRADGWSIAKLEQTLKHHWRTRMTTGERTHFSKAKRIIEAIEEQASQRDDHSIDNLVMEWNDIMKNRKGIFSTSGMIKWLVEMGFVERKRARGTHVKK